MCILCITRLILCSVIHYHVHNHAHGMHNYAHSQKVMHMIIKVMHMLIIVMHMLSTIDKDQYYVLQFLIFLTMS